jgi:dienelactone hydrolase
MSMDDLAGRNISLENHFQEMGKTHRPRYRFEGTDEASFLKWKSELRPQVLASLKRTPEKVPLNPKVVSERVEDGIIKQRVILDVEPNLCVAALLYRPEKSSGKLPAILCCHGHGPYGKDAVMGVRANPEMEKHIAQLNYDYGLQMAKAGFVTIAIDWRGFGERDDRRRGQDVVHSRDICDVHYVRETLLGRTLLGMDVHDGRCVLDYLCTLDFVDANRLGVMGLSFGGTMTTWMALVDERLKAADIICYSDRFPSFGLTRANFCGSQITPGLFELADVPDLHGLIAPRPLLVEIGKKDDCFLPEPAMSCYHEVEKIYQAAGAHEHLVLDLFDGGHQWGANMSVRFFKKYLA